MLLRPVHAKARSASACHVALKSAEHALQYCEPALEITSVDDEWRKESERVIAGRDDEKAGIPASLHDFTCRLHDIDAPHVPQPANRAYAGAFPRNRSKPLSQPLAILLHRAQKVRIGEPADNVIFDSRDERAYPECSSMISGLDRFGDLRCDERRAHW